jgi:segregation and condensation protein B
LSDQSEVKETQVEAGIDRNDLAAAVGAVIFASGEPVQPKEIAAALKGITVAEVKEAIDALEAIYASNEAGLRLEWVAGGIRLVTRPEVADWVRQFFRQRHRTRLSPAALETLAIVAYRQPVTAPEVQAIRGKDPQGALRNLIEKKLLKILGKKKVVGTPLLYGTSKQFLVHFGLNSLNDLPSMEEFDAFVGTLDHIDVVDSDDEADAASAAPDSVEVPADTEENEAEASAETSAEADAETAETAPEAANSAASSSEAVATSSPPPVAE